MLLRGTSCLLAPGRASVAIHHPAPAQHSSDSKTGVCWGFWGITSKIKEGREAAGSKTDPAGAGGVPGSYLPYQQRRKRKSSEHNGMVLQATRQDIKHRKPCTFDIGDKG